MSNIREKLLDALAESLSDLGTGPLSDTPYYGAELEDDGALSLYRSQSIAFGFPDASVDLPQLVDDILRSFEVTER